MLTMNMGAAERALGSDPVRPELEAIDPHDQEAVFETAKTLLARLNKEPVQLPIGDLETLMTQAAKKSQLPQLEKAAARLAKNFREYVRQAWLDANSKPILEDAAARLEKDFEGLQNAAHLRLEFLGDLLVEIAVAAHGPSGEYARDLAVDLMETIRAASDAEFPKKYEARYLEWQAAKDELAALLDKKAKLDPVVVVVRPKEKGGGKAITGGETAQFMDSDPYKEPSEVKFRLMAREILQLRRHALELKEELGFSSGETSAQSRAAA